jgi:hypothetical protein
LALLLVVAAVWPAPAHWQDIAVTRWIDDGSGRRPGTYQEWQQANPQEPWRVELRSQRHSTCDVPVDIIVNSTLYDSIRPALDTFLADLTREGYAPGVFTARGGTPESLRAFLQNEYAAGMQGAVLIGILPVAWAQMVDDWNGNGRRDPDENYEEFPCDLYYMDLDGIWLDSLRRVGTQDSLTPGSDGILDVHRDNVTPEIWLGRITAGPCGNEKTLVSNYLAKTHDYRTGEIALNDRALLFVDDDWAVWTPEYDAALATLYPDRVIVNDLESTWTPRYRRALAENYQWIALYSHSNPQVHAMKYNNGSSWSWFYEQEVPGLNPVANFYNLFACSNARYTDTGYMAGRYIYSTTTGLNSVGSTKTGSMLDFVCFYEPMGNGYSIGQAFKSWFDSEGGDGYDAIERSWFYGMCLNGDPTLRPRLPAHDVGVSAIVSPSGTIDSGAAVVPVCRVTNYGSHPETFDVRFRIGSTYSEVRGKSVARGMSDTIVFPAWTAQSVGMIATQCSTMLGADERSQNDACNWWVTVRHPTSIADAPEHVPPVRFSVEPSIVFGAASVHYVLPQATDISLTMYDRKGSTVGHWARGRQSAGSHDIELSFETGRGMRLPSGVYLLRFEAGGVVSTRRLVVTH